MLFSIGTFNVTPMCSIPVVIEGLTNEWLTGRSWRRQSLLEQRGHTDILVSHKKFVYSVLLISATTNMQVGPIPYGEIFGEIFGYATIEEFVSYMDRYRLSSSTEPNHTSFKAPLYVFDSEMLKEHFIGHYDLQGNNNKCNKKIILHNIPIYH